MLMPSYNIASSFHGSPYAKSRWTSKWWVHLDEVSIAPQTPTIFSPPSAAVSEGGDPTVREGYAARPHSSDIALHDHGVPCLRDYLVSRHPDHLRIYCAHTAADANFREGTHAKYHYLICGVQGDFTRSLVNDPPTHIWTRQLKVKMVGGRYSTSRFADAPACHDSSLECHTRPLFTSEGSVSAPEQASEPRSQLVSRYDNLPISSHWMTAEGAIFS